MEQSPQHSTDTLRAGQRIGHYEITSLLGAGGMGEVYRAHDHRLGRDVAVKVLPARYSDNPSRARRFAAEARTTGSVSHPNIVSVYDAGEVEGRAYLVVELLHGDTLRAFLERQKPLAVRTAISYAVQIARGLAAAHDRGVVHRDLKPSNLFVTSDGHVKILDFGLAKVLQPGSETVARTDDTLSIVSEPGMVFGSSGYMSPEQVEARPADQRSDIFALGAILYEMLAGRRAFQGSSPAATLSAVLEDQPPDLTTLRPEIPSGLATTVSRCLEKRPDDRLQSARDLAFTLEQFASPSSASLTSIGMAAIHLAAAKLRNRPAMSTGAIAIAAAAIFVVLASSWTQTEARRIDEPGPPPFRPPEIHRVTSTGNAGFTVCISPDGEMLAFDRDKDLWLTRIATHGELRLHDLESGYIRTCRFSPDGNFVYYSVGDTTGRANLYRLPVLGGDPALVTEDVGSPWGDDILTFEPRGARFAFNRQTGSTSQLVVAATDGSAQSVLAAREAGRFLSCAWSPDGSSILCGSTDSLLAIDTATGAERRLPDTSLLIGVGSLEWMPDGSAFVGLAGSDSNQQIARVSWPDLRLTRLTNDLSSYLGVSISGDGRSIATIRIDITTNLWSVSTRGDPDLRQLTTGVNTHDGNQGVTTTPDGRIVWASGASGKSVDLVIAEADGSGRRRITFDDEAWERWPDVSPDGRFVTYTRRPSSTSSESDIWLLELRGLVPTRLTTLGDATGAPSFSADGRWIYFHRYVGDEPFIHRVSVEGGEPEQVIDELGMGARPSPDGRWLMLGTSRGVEIRSTSGDRESMTLKKIGLALGGARRWSPDSSSIAYAGAADGGLNLWIRELAADESRQLTRFPRGDIVAWGFDWTSDGERIVFARRTQTNDVVVLKEAR